MVRWSAWMVVLAGTGACAGAAPSTSTVTPSSTTGSEAGAAPASVSAPASAPEPVPAPASASASASAPPVTGGSVLIGDIVAPPSFDPKPALVSAKSELLGCYNKARQATPSLHGRLTLRINVNETGKVMLVDAAPGGSVDDPALVACLSDALKAVTFPKPAGLATVSAPLVFRP